MFVLSAFLSRSSNFRHSFLAFTPSNCNRAIKSASSTISFATALVVTNFARVANCNVDRVSST